MKPNPLRERFRSLLEIPLQWTFYFDEVTSRGLSDKQLEDLRRAHGDEAFQELARALAWAVEDSGAGLGSIMPHVQYSEKELQQYLDLLHRQFEQKCREWFGREH